MTWGLLGVGPRALPGDSAWAALNPARRQPWGKGGLGRHGASCDLKGSMLGRLRCLLGLPVDVSARGMQCFDAVDAHFQYAGRGLGAWQRRLVHKIPIHRLLELRTNSRAPRTYPRRAWERTAQHRLPARFQGHSVSTARLKPSQTCQQAWLQHASK